MTHNVLFASGADFILGANFAGLLQGNFGEEGAYQLVDQHREQGDVGYHRAVLAQTCLGLNGHTQRHTGLGQQGDAQIFYYLTDKM